MEFSNKIKTEQDLLLLGNMYVVSRALHTVAQHKIADLFDGSGEKSVDALSKALSLSPVVLKRVLRLLCPFGLFKESNDGKFSLEEAGQLLKSNHPSLMNDLLFCEAGRWNSFGQMSDMQAGETGFSKLYGEDYFEHIAKDTRLQTGFDDHMNAVSAKEDPIIASKLANEKKEKLIDVGGSRGGLIHQVLQMNLNVTGGLFDLPGVAVEDIKALSAQYGKRLETYSGDFFETLPFKSDGIILKRVLHDWDDERSAHILSNCRDALTDGGEIYVVESVSEGKDDSTLFRIFDLLLLTVFGGIERDEKEYQALFQSAGLSLNRIISTEAGLSILVAVKL